MALPIQLPVRPMLARLSPGLPGGDGWLFEPKFDGFRIGLAREGSDVSLWSRNGHRLDARFPQVVAAARSSMPDGIFDGELVAAGAGGRETFAALLEGQRGSEPSEFDVSLGFVAFDLLATGREDLRSRPLTDRRRLLEEALPTAGVIVVTPQTSDPAAAKAWLEDSLLGLEGVVAKKGSQGYKCGRRGWLKIKRWESADLVVGGYVGHVDGPWSLLLGAYDATGALRFVGRTQPLSEAQMRPVANRLRGLERICSPFTGGPIPGRSRWESHRFEEWVPLDPALVCEVEFSRLDGDFIRHVARFVRWREDKDAVDCGLAIDPRLGSAPSGDK